MVDKNNNGIDDKFENLNDLASALGVEAPTPETTGGEDGNEEEVSRIFAGDIRVPLYDSGIRQQSVGRIPVEKTREQALAEFGAFSDRDRRRLSRLAEAAGVDTKFSSLQWFWQQGVNNAEAAYAAGQRVSPWDYLESWAQEPAAGRSGRGGGFGGGGGPTARVTMMNERDLRMTADSIASEVIGRGVTDQEFQKILRRVRSAEMAEPGMTRVQGNAVVTEPGLSSEGRQDIITQMLMQGPEAEDFTKATTMMDAFYKALSEAPRGA